MPPRSPPRLPPRKKPGTNSLIVVVCSSRVWLQHKASCYRGHGYSNILSSLQGLHYCYTTRSDLQGGIHLVRECPTEAIRPAEAHPTAHQRGPGRSKVLSARGSWAIAPRTPGLCEDGEFQRRSAIRPCHNAELDVFQSFRTRLHRGGAHTRNPTWR